MDRLKPSLFAVIASFRKPPLTNNSNRVTGMKEVVLDNEGHLIAVFEACAKGGHSQIGCISNTGLGAGAARITILPNTAFTEPPDYSDKAKDSCIQAFRDCLYAKVSETSDEK